MQLSVKLVGGGGLVNRPSAFVHVRLNSKPFSLLVDSGSSVSIVSYPQFLHAFPNFRTHTVANTPVLTAVNGMAIRQYASLRLTVRLGEKNFAHTFVIADTTVSVLGWDFLYMYKLVLDARAGALLSNDVILTYLEPLSHSSMASTAAVPNRSWSRPNSGHRRPTHHWQPRNTMPRHQQWQPCPRAPPRVDECARPTTQPYANASSQQIPDKSNDLNAHQPPLTKQSDISNSCTPAHQEQPSRKDKSALGSAPSHFGDPASVQFPSLQETPQDLRNPIWNLCKKFPKVFAPGIHPLASHDFKCTIQMFDEPRMLKPYRVPLPYQEPVGKRFLELLQLGVVERSSSHLASPLVVVKKPNGDLRPCVDFRAVNRVTTRDAYPLPRIADLIQSIRGSIFSQVDLRDAYYQLPMAEQDKHLTAVTTPIGLVQFRRMPFGLRNAASCFQRFIDHVFSGMEFVRTYIDDIVVVGNSAEEHATHLDAVFAKLNAYGLVINGQKSKFALPIITFLGFEVTQHGYRPADKCLPKINSLETPRTRRELQRLLGVINFYRGHVPAMARILAPVYQLLSPKVKFRWGAEQQAALDQVKDILQQRIPLQQANMELPFTLHTDASQEAVGAVLSQDAHPVGYFSKQLTPTEKRYSAFDREALAIVLALRYFRP